MDELTLWEIIEGFEKAGDLGFTLEKDSNGWCAFFDAKPYVHYSTRKEALIYAITKLKLEA
jgi:hypothetical protein